MKRILLFLATNLAVLVVISVVFRVLGIDSLLTRSGSSLDLQSLLVYSAVIGFAGSFVSLLMSKWLAKQATGARVIDTPRSSAESFVLATVRRHADAAGIRCPEVAIYDSPEVNAFATGASRNNAFVAVSTGLMNRLGQREIEAVLATRSRTWRTATW
jgi:heat shock protein HtpX